MLFFSTDFCSFFLTDGFFACFFFSSTPAYSRKAAVITSTSLALKKTRYFGGSAPTSFFQAVINPVLSCHTVKGFDIFICDLYVGKLYSPCAFSCLMVCFPCGFFFQSFFGLFPFLSPEPVRSFQPFSPALFPVSSGCPFPGTSEGLLLAHWQ